MKRLFFATLTSVCSLATLHADITVVQKLDGMGISSESTTKVKGDKTRVDPVPGMTMIMDSGSGDIINIMHQQKSYMKIPAEAAKMAVAKMTGPDGAAASAKPKLTATGKKETINSFPSSEYTCEIGGHKTTVWLTTALPNYQAALKELTAAMNHGPLAATMQAFSVYSDDLPGFPVRTISEASPGQTITATTLSLSTKPIADSEFSIPAEYKEMAMPVLTPPAAATPASH